MIVTNDEYETPIICDVVGKQAVADFIGVTLTTFYRCLKADKWQGEYKAIDLGYEDEQDEFEPNTSVVAYSESERKIELAKKRETKKRKNKEKWREIGKEKSRQFYEEHREERLQYMREYYIKNREERLSYSKRYQEEIRKGIRVCCAR